MFGNRNWRDMPPRIKENLNGFSGYAGLGAAFISLAGWTALPGFAANTVGGVGGAISIVAFVTAIIQAVPPAFRRPDDVVGKVIKIEELQNIYPKPKTVAIIGPSMAGKTTLKDRLLWTHAQPQRTQEIFVYVAALQVSPPVYVALLDGGGEKYAQQFKIAELADFLCIVLDHNKSDMDTSIHNQRVDEHKSFLRQVEHHLTESGVKKKNWIQFLINKHDLWRRASPQDIQDFEKFYMGEAERWHVGQKAKKVEVRSHSNGDAADVTRFMTSLKGL